MNNEEVAKRRAYRRKKARKRHFIAGFIIFLIFSVAIFVVLSLTVLFPIKTVIISGSNKYSASTVSSATSFANKNIFTFSEEKLLEDLRAKLPYVEKVKIKRQLPDTVKIIITDAKRYAVYESDGKFAEVSEKGYVLETTDKLPENTLHIKAKNVKAELGKKIKLNKSDKQAIKTITEELTKRNIKINSIDVTDSLDINAKILDGKFKVIFGSKTNLPQKCNHLEGMLNSFDDNVRGTVNLSMWTKTNRDGTLIRENS